MKTLAVYSCGMLTKRQARLRRETGTEIARAANRLCGPAGFTDAFRAVLYDHPALALRRIARAEQHLRKAKAALRAWMDTT